MVLTESQLRKVINEELKQYLIEEGFLSNIKDTAKSVYQKFTGGDKQAQTTAAPASSKATNVPAVNPQIAKQIRDKNIIDKQKTNEYGFLIQNANDINNAWKYYNTLKANNQANIALKQIFNNLRANIQHRKDRAQPLTNREIEIYQRFIKFIEDQGGAYFGESATDKIFFEFAVSQLPTKAQLEILGKRSPVTVYGGRQTGLMARYIG